MATVCNQQLFLQLRESGSRKPPLSSDLVTHRFQLYINNRNWSSRLVPAGQLSGFSVPRSSPVNNSISPVGDDEEGVSLGTMKLPMNTDLDRFETLLFQKSNQVDKVKGGVRLGFITIGDGVTEVPVYIDCLVFPAAGDLPPVFRAVRYGPMKDRSPPGEPRIMKSLLAALQKSVELAAI
ncbi:hypothetical protein E3N88_31852 [Mikania micrantha]|uniref:DUF7148 domain-containing protein n=1 Tax=Mikania micrantha TaxID=192012 RepID=A0A5N6M7I8_9ASTR|nr:hypothetical protein E3N88_31852 [Mikania micrantha]